MKYTCNVCGWEYDPAVGDPDGGIAPGTSFEDIPEDWVCPVCGAGKSDFEAAAGDAQAGAADGENDPDAMWQCQMSNCGYIYRPQKGDLPDDWRCPVCGASKKMFKKL